jgi:predicted nucleic acid-binding protein
VRFWDASALIPLVLEEQTSATINALFRSDPSISVWWATRIEAFSVIARLVRERRLDLAGEAVARARLERLLKDGAEVAPTSDVRDRAERLLPTHPLRAADALQLAAALIWARMRPAGMEFVSLDQRLREAASKEGFSVLPTTLT